MDNQLTQWVAGGTCSVAEAAQILGVSADTILRMIADGVLIAWKPNPLGRKKRLYIKQVEQVAASSQSRAIKYARAMTAQLELF